MVDERPRLTASEIEEELFAALQKLPTLHDTQSVTIRPYSGPKSWRWELDKIEPAEQVRRRGGRCCSLAATIRPRSKPSAASLRISHRKGYSASQIEGPLLRQQLADLIKAARRSRAGTTSGCT
jgi:hypothetical protein